MQQAVYRRRHRAEINERNRARRTEDPEGARQRDKEHRKTDSYQRAQTRYRAKPKARRKDGARVRRYRRRQRLIQMANIPVPVIRPFVAVMAKDVGGQRELARRTGVHERLIWAIIKEERKGMTIDTCDKLAVYSGLFTLDELAERAREWAQLTGDRWPVGYHPRFVDTYALD